MYKLTYTMEIAELLQKEILLVKSEDLQKLADLLSERQPSKPQPEVKEIERPIPQSEAFVFLGKSRQTFYKWRRKGIIKGHTLGGRIYFFKSELIAALNKS